MAVISVACPHCAARYKVDEALRGKKAKCKKCSTPFVLDAVPISRSDASVATPTLPTATGTAPPERPRGDDGILRDWQPGDVILDRYEVIALPGTKHGYAEGGMGRVNLVRHRDWQRDLAVKSVLPAKSASARDLENFKSEAEQWVDKIGLHPNIVACHYVRVLGGVPRVFIEYVDGGSLQDWIETKRLYEGGQEAALARILDVAIQMAWGLHYIHELGLIHQDVKPLNVMMTKDGVARITDFGLAGAKANAFHEDTPAAGAGTILATWGGMTPAYCSPEQAEIAAKRKAGVARETLPKLTRRTDLWSWAASVLVLFLGKVLWPAGQVAHLGLQREPDEPHLPLPDTVKELLRGCLQKKPEERPHDLKQVAETLCRIHQQVTGCAYPREQPNAAEALADTFNNRAVSLFDLGKPEAAEQKWQEALKVDPCHPEATYNRGLIQWRSAQLTDEKLLQQLREARGPSASTTQVDYLMGLVHLERGATTAAVELLNLAVAGSSERVDFASALALAKSLQNPDSPCPTPFQGHQARVNSVAWSPDARHVLSGSDDRSLRLWDTTGRCLHIMEGHTGGVNSVAWSPAGRLALSGGKDHQLRLWDISSGQCLRTLEEGTHIVSSVTWGPDGRFACTGSYDRTVRLWEMPTGRCLRTLEGHTSQVNVVSASPDGCRVVSGSFDGTVRLWEVSSGNCLGVFQGPTGNVTAVAWSPDGQALLIGGDSTIFQLCKVSTGQCLRTFAGHTAGVTAVTWSPDGGLALSGSWDKTLRVWEVSSGRCLRTFEGHTSAVLSVAWSLVGSFVLSGSGDQTMRLWRTSVPRQPVSLVTSRVSLEGATLYRQLLQQAQDALATHPAVAADYLQRARQQPGCSRRDNALAVARQVTRFLPHRRFVEGWEQRILEGHTGCVNSVSWSPDGRCVLSASLDRTIRLWEVASGRCRRTFVGHTDSVDSVVWSADGSLVLSGSADRTLRLWEAASGVCLRTFEGDPGAVRALAWSPDGCHVLSGCGDDTLRVWEVASGKCVCSFDVWFVDEYDRGVTSVAWSPDGRLALAGNFDQTLALCELTSGQCLRRFESHLEAVKGVAWSPDGSHVLSASSDQSLRLWSVSSGQCLRILAGHTAAVNAVAWSPDGRFALSGSEDQTLRLWAVSSGQCLRIFAGHTAAVNTVAWSPDGHFALSGSWDGKLRLWELDWEFNPKQLADWDEDARPFLTAFLTLHTPHAEGLARRGKPSWTEDDFRRLLDRLGYAGFGWLRPEGVRRELEKMAATWEGPPPLV